jgi:hypothetical protein
MVVLQVFDFACERGAGDCIAGVCLFTRLDIFLFLFKLTGNSRRPFENAGRGCRKAEE